MDRARAVASSLPLSLIAIGALLASSAFGCGGEERKPPAAPVRTTAAEQQLASVVRVEDACNIPALPEAQPQFDFDSAQLRERGERIVSAVASCLTAGPLSDAEVIVVGRADPRGPARYNEQLGLYRAEAVRLLLLERGVPDDRIRVVSQGEEDAHPNADRWQLDRRVDIVITSPDALPSVARAPARGQE
jgi:outer membrane protein OmpA-like peptidoglycan-associated protein